MNTTGKIIVKASKYYSQFNKGIISFAEFENAINSLLYDLFRLDVEIRFTYKTLCNMKEKAMKENGINYII